MQKLSQGVFVVVVVVGEKNVCGGVFYFLFFQSTTARQQPLVKINIYTKVQYYINIYSTSVVVEVTSYVSENIHHRCSSMPIRTIG
jgi:hypothetical protein